MPFLQVLEYEPSARFIIAHSQTAGARDVEPIDGDDDKAPACEQIKQVIVAEMVRDAIGCRTRMTTRTRARGMIAMEEDDQRITMMAGHGLTGPLDLAGYRTIARRSTFGYAGVVDPLGNEIEFVFEVVVYFSDVISPRHACG